MNLESLPVEVLAQILGGHYSWTALELWKTGSKLLRAKLASGGVRNIDLVAHSTTRQPPQWPKALKEFRGLRSLSVVVYDRYSSIGSLRTIHRELLQLPRGLKRLSLGFPHALGAFFLETQPHVSNNVGGPPPAKRFKREEINAKNSESLQITVGSVLDELETLEFVQEHDSDPVLTDRIFALLPRSLTAFNLKYPNPRSCGEPPLEDTSAFPPNLTKLDLPFSDKSICNVPKQITQISEASPVAFQLYNDPSLLPNLEWLPSPDLGSVEIARCIASIITHWPPNIHTVHLNDLTPTLPSKLVKLDVQQRSPFPQGWVTSILPRTLEELVTRDFDWKNISSSDWPPTLTSISLSSHTHIPWFGVQHWHRLPRSLANLNVSFNKSMDRKAVDSVDHLLALGRDCLTNVEKQEWINHRAALILHGEKDGGREREAMAEYILSIESGHLFGLPLRLRRLDLDNHFPCDHIDPIVVPPMLTTLKLLLKERIHPKHFPPSLLNLNCSPEKNSTRPMLWNGAYFSSHPASPLSLSHLDSFTMSLHSPLSKTPFVDDDLTALAKGLPRTLRRLSLYGGWLYATITMLESLPRTLTSLTLPDLIRKPMTREWLLALPKALTHLDARSFYLLGPLWKHLPPKLVSLSVSVKKTTLQDFLEAPRTLEQCSLNFIDGFRKEDPDAPQYLCNLSLEDIEEYFYPLWKVFQAPFDLVQSIVPYEDYEDEDD